MTVGMHPILPSAVGIWRGDETYNGASMVDATGQGRHLTNPDGWSPVPANPTGGKFQGARGPFNVGVYSGQYTRCQAWQAAWCKPSVMTLSVWARPDAVSQKSNPEIIRFFTGDSGGSNTALVIGATGAADKKFRIYGTNIRTGHAQDTITASSSWADLSWYMLTLTYSGAAMKFYLDGLPVGTVSGCKGALTYGASNWFMVVGTYNVFQGRQWIGLVDDMALYDTAMTDAEVGAIYFGPPTWAPVSPTSGVVGVSPRSTVVGDLVNPSGGGFDSGWAIRIKVGDGDWSPAYVDGGGFQRGWNGASSGVTAIANGYRVEVDPVDDFPRGAVVQVQINATAPGGAEVELA